MQFQGIDLHTNKFTVCTRTEKSSVDNPKDKQMATYDISEAGLAEYFRTTTKDTYVLIEATITTFSFARLIKDKVKEVLIANTYELKTIKQLRLSAPLFVAHRNLASGLAPFAGNQPCTDEHGQDRRGQVVPHSQDAGAFRGTDYRACDHTA
jgi:hypothetical protein